MPPTRNADLNPGAADDVIVVSEMALLGAAVGAAAGGILSIGQTAWRTIWRR